MFGTIALVSTALASFAAAAPITTESRNSEVFGNFTTSFWYDGSYTGSCGYTNSTKQYIASIRNANASLHSACGKTINITDLDRGSHVLAMVVDEVVDAPKNYLNVSRVTFQHITVLDTEFFNASYVFVDAPVPEWTAPADEQDSNDDAPVYTPKKQQQQAKATPKAVAASSPKQEQQQQQAPAKEVEQQPQQPKTTSSSRKVEQQKQYTPPTTSSKKEVYTPETTPKQAEYTPKTTSKKEVYTPKTTPKQAEYTPKTTSKKEVYTPKATPKEAAYTPKTTSKKAVETPKKASSGGGGQFSGRGTWYTQNGNAGACGSVNSDSAYIVAVNSAQYAGGSHCGQSVRISAGGRSITARVADLCPGCPYGGLDLSTGAFQALGSLGQGVLSLSWSWA